MATNNKGAEGTNNQETTTFKSIVQFNDPRLQWYCPPESWSKTETSSSDNNDKKVGWWKINKDNGKLLLAPTAKKDFWRKTYYKPLLVKDDGPFLYATIAQETLPVTVETSFSLSPQAQFDQAGIIIRLDAEHWIKTGIEVVDNTPRLSCVVTNGFSDWSTQKWAPSSTNTATATTNEGPALKIRVHLLPQHGGSFVVEAAPVGTNDWAFVRIAHLNRDFNHPLLDNEETVTNAFRGESAAPNTLMVGVFAACPVDQAGMVATFENISISQGSGFVHDA